MNKIYRRISRVLCMLYVAAWMGCMISVSTAYAADMTYPDGSSTSQRVYDDADLFTDSEETGLEKEVELFKNQYHMDMVIVTTDDAHGKSAMEYADDFYDYGKFGNGKNADGLLYLIDMDNREVYISTAGIAIRMYTDERIDSMLDEVYTYIPNGNYGFSASVFIREAGKFAAEGIQANQYTYDEDTGTISRYKSIRWYEALIAIVVPFVVACSYCLNINNTYAMKDAHKTGAGYALAYRALAAFAFATIADELIDKQVSRRTISTSSGSSSGSFGGGHSSSGRSSSHHSSSGRSHGGGGRHF